MLRIINIMSSEKKYVPNFGGNAIMEEIYNLKMAELAATGVEPFKQAIRDKLVRVVEKIATSFYQELYNSYRDKSHGITKDVQLFSWFASEWQRHGESTEDKPLPVQPHFFIKALIDPEIGLFKYGDKCFFHRKEGGVWKQDLFFKHEWEEKERGYSAAVGAMTKSLTKVWTNRKALCLYSREHGFTAFPRGKLIDFDSGYESDKQLGHPAVRYVRRGEQKPTVTYTDMFGYKLRWFEEPFATLIQKHPEWHNMDMVELKNILIETLILFHELIHALTNTAHQKENQDTESEAFPAMPKDYPAEDFAEDDWPDFDEAGLYMKAISKDDAEEYEDIGKTLWPFFSDGSGHGVEFCNMYSLFAGMRGQTTLCAVSRHNRKDKIAAQKKLPGGIARAEEPDGSQVKPGLKSPKAKKKKILQPEKEGDGTTTWVQQLYIKLRF